MIKKGLMEEKGVRVFHDVPKYAYMQALFASGDRRTGALIERIASGDHLAVKDKSFERDLDFFVFRKKDISENLPVGFYRRRHLKGKTLGRVSKGDSRVNFPCLYGSLYVYKFKICHPRA